MKAIARQLLVFSGLLVMLFGAVPAAYAIQGVDTPKSDTDGVFVGEPTTLTISASVAVDPNLMPSSINLVRVNDQGQTTVLGRMYDDGTHGDALRGDSKFTAQITLNEAASGNINLMVTAAYKGVLLRAKSPILTLPALVKPTDAQIARADQLAQDAENYYAQLIAQGQTIQQAQLALVQFLKNQLDVVSVLVSADGRIVSYMLNSGLSGGIFTGENGTQGGGNAAHRLIERLALAGQRAGKYRTLLTQTVLTATATPTGNGNSIVLAPFFADFTPFDASDDIYADLQGTCGTPKIYKNSDVTLSRLKGLNQYGAIFINTHGGVDTDKNVLLMSHEQASFSSKVFNIVDWVLGRIKPIGIGGSNYWAIKPGFITRYAGGGFPKRLCSPAPAIRWETLLAATTHLWRTPFWVRAPGLTSAIRTAFSPITTLVSVKACSAY